MIFAPTTSDARALGFLLFLGAAEPAAAQRIMDTRWLETVRENVLMLQERHRERIMRVEEQRAATATSAPPIDAYKADATAYDTRPEVDPE